MKSSIKVIFYLPQLLYPSEANLIWCDGTVPLNLRVKIPFLDQDVASFRFSIPCFPDPGSWPLLLIPAPPWQKRNVVGNIGMLEVRTEETYNLAALRIRIRDENFGSYFRKLRNNFFV